MLYQYLQQRKKPQRNMNISTYIFGEIAINFSGCKICLYNTIEVSFLIYRVNRVTAAMNLLYIYISLLIKKTPSTYMYICHFV